MQISNQTRLQTLLSEIKNRFFFIFISFLLCFTVAYQNCTPLLYLFVLSYSSINPILKDGKSNRLFSLFEILPEDLRSLVLSLANSTFRDNIVYQNYLLLKVCFGGMCQSSIGTVYPSGQGSLSGERELGNAFDTLCEGMEKNIVTTKTELVQHLYRRLCAYAQEATTYGKTELVDPLLPIGYTFGYVKQESPISTEILEELHSPLVSGACKGTNFVFTNFSHGKLANLSNALHSVDMSSMHFIFTDIEEAFSTQISVCLFFSFITIFPLFFYETFSFFSSSLYHCEYKKWGYRFFGTLFFWYYYIYGVYSVFIPKLAEFLFFFQVSNDGFNVLAEPKINSYCFWTMSIFLALTFIFFFVAFFFFYIASERCSLYDMRRFTSYRGVNVLFIFILSALIAPPDYLQILLTLIFFSFFELFTCYIYIYKHFIEKL